MPIPFAQGALIFPTELERACERARIACGATLEPELLEVLIHNQDYFLRVEKCSFGPAIRHALNASCIRKKQKRERYAAALGFYYSPHAQAVAKRIRRKNGGKLPTRPPRIEPILTTVNPGSGQISLVL